MELTPFKVFTFLFHVSCFISVLCLVSVWVHKFMKDEDLCLVEYKSLGTTTDTYLPDVSLCIQYPFLDEKLNDLGTNTTAYYKHLSGDDFNENLLSINYTNVTFDLEKYYHGTRVYGDGEVDENMEGEFNTRFNGFFFGDFIKCYGIDTKTSNVQHFEYIVHYFKLDAVDFLSTKKVYAVIHAPSQLVLSVNQKEVKFEGHGNGMELLISKVEVLRQRNKPKEPCVMQRNWNDLLLLKHVKEIGCLPSYQESNKKFPMCSAINETKRWYNIWDKTRNERDYLPCQQMPRIDFAITNTKYTTTRKADMLITVGYPKQAKIITQSRAVDINTLIGNIGGYIGLFLGT